MVVIQIAFRLIIATWSSSSLAKAKTRSKETQDMAETPDLQVKLEYDRMKEVKAFDDTKTGVQGLVDAGAVNIARIFIRPPEEIAEDQTKYCKHTKIQVPNIDLRDTQRACRRKEAVEEVKLAAEKWGFFQVVNHGIPQSVIDQMVDGVRSFNQQDVEVKKTFYTRDLNSKVLFNSNYDLYKSRYANWRDSLAVTIEYLKHLKNLADTLFEMLSEALGLSADHLGSIACTEECSLVCHYYPACPEPDLTLGASKHSDPGLLTLLVQNHLSGLQVLHEGQWVDVPRIPGSVIVNVGDLLQILSNDMFKSVDHRVVSNLVGPRISVVCFFRGCSSKPLTYRPIQELTADHNPSRYKDFISTEYFTRYRSKPLHDLSVLEYYKI
ncbi:hypothetical protein K2173_011436 [Erythroxylum novogranatense]|uniref:Fe2OG dioxygenase domain-containing protein n=1 Tax=Erythroxylum novogranatense TaxID=1862640 RepID=A0AAV8TE70_9ROSI|nr:hypothetical protein K2173_011436 [Erythroxylum novogranatense]